MKFNFDGKSAAEVFNVPEDRGNEISSNLSDACLEIANNFEPYTFQIIDGEFAGSTGMHKGKILERLLKAAKNENEKMLIVYSSTFLTNKIDQIRGIEGVEVIINQA